MRPRRGLLFPILLIFIGIVFMLSNFGLIGPLTWGALLQLWPLLLVVFGVELLLGPRQPYLALAIEVGLVILGVALVASQPRFAGVVFGPGESRVTVGREAERSLELSFSGSAGRYRFSSGAGDALVDARSSGTDLRLGRVSRTGDTASVDLEQGTSGPFFGSASPLVEVRVGTEARLALDVSVGAGTFSLDLRDVPTRDVRLSAGAGTTQVVLPRPAGDVQVHIDKGAGTVMIEVPEGVEARVSVGGGVVRLSSTNPRLAAQGGLAETSGYGVARDRVTVSITSGAGTVTVR